MIVVVGGANLDVIARPFVTAAGATSSPGRVGVTAGGVGRNIAENLARLGTPTHLVCALGRDSQADLVLDVTAAAGVGLTHVRRVDAATGSYVALLDADGELVAAVSDMAAHLEPADLDPDLLQGADLVVLDANLPTHTLAAAWDLAAAGQVPVAVDPVSVVKAARIAVAARGRRLYLLSAGEAEIGGLVDVAADITWQRRGPAGSTLRVGDDVHHLAAAGLGSGGVVDVTGAGDSMLAAFCHAVLEGADPVEAAAFGHAAAALTVASAHTVRPDLSAELVRSLM